MTAREAPTDRARPASPVILAEAALIGLVILVLGITGPFGTYDKQQLQRGLKIYKEVCSACHSM
ncbi:cytochrome c1, partial [Klebsiella pneumoniae]|uniref:cytochrome c1 n=1 Tax=Klebsiella pneumoniae TaxID=573 RepID=UPI0034D40C45